MRFLLQESAFHSFFDLKDADFDGGEFHVKAIRQLSAGLRFEQTNEELGLGAYGRVIGQSALVIA